MELSKISKKPELIEITLDDQDIIDEYGESLSFFTYDRQPLEVFTKMAGASPDKPETLINALRPMILDKEGKPVIQGEQMIPSKVLVKALAKLVAQLGN